MFRKHKVTIDIRWSSLYRDIADKAYRIAKLSVMGMDNEKTSTKVESDLSLTTDDNNMLKRAATSAFADIISMCAEYVHNKSHISNNLTLAENDINLILMMPFNYNLAGNYELATMMHKYIVAKSLETWFTYTMLGDKQMQAIKTQAEDAQSAELQIRTILSRRIRPQRPRVMEFVVDPNPEDIEGD